MPNKVNKLIEDDNCMPFPQRLMEILSNDKYSHIISWLPHGQAWVIHKREEFVKEVLPRYFRQVKYTSFTRKLNRWRFRRVSKGPEMGAYYHPLFKKEEPSLCRQMICENPSNRNYPQGIQQEQHYPTSLLPSSDPVASMSTLYFDNFLAPSLTGGLTQTQYKLYYEMLERKRQEIATRLATPQAVPSTTYSSTNRNKRAKAA